MCVSIIKLVKENVQVKVENCGWELLPLISCPLLQVCLIDRGQWVLNKAMEGINKSEGTGRRVECNEEGGTALVMAR